MNNSKIKFNEIKSILMEEFEGKCAYCGSKFGLTSGVDLDDFYPKNKYPEKAYQLENLLPACSICNKTKSDKFPVNDKGEPLLLNPRTDNFDEHIQINSDGSVIPKTEKGKITIELLQLNRPALIEDRKIRLLEKEFVSNFRQVNKNYFENFQEKIKIVKSLNDFNAITNNLIIQHLKNMLYANLITSLETYLCDAFIHTVRSKKEYIRRFVETYHSFKSEKFELREIYLYYENIDNKAIQAMLDVIYHDLPKVRGMYNDTLNIRFPDLSNIYNAVLKRHDFVHRNGKTKDGKFHEIDAKDIAKLCNDIEIFVNNINSQLLALG